MNVFKLKIYWLPFFKFRFIFFTNKCVSKASAKKGTSISLNFNFNLKKIFILFVDRDSCAMRRATRSLEYLKSEI